MLGLAHGANPLFDGSGRGEVAELEGSSSPAGSFASGSRGDDGSTNPLSFVIRDRIRPRDFDHATDLVRGRPLERAWIYPGDGSAPYSVDQRSPYERVIDLDENTMRKLRGGRSVHNHTGETIFSPEDLKAFADSGQFQSRIITPQGRVFDLFGSAGHGLDDKTLEGILYEAHMKAAKQMPVMHEAFSEEEWRQWDQILRSQTGPYVGKVWVTFHRR